jgi:hypothetical protein
MPNMDDREYARVGSRKARKFMETAEKKAQRKAQRNPKKNPQKTLVDVLLEIAQSLNPDSDN